MEILSEFIEAEAKRIVDDYKLEFRRIQMEQDDMRLLEDYACEVGSNSKHFVKNRYRDILPYDKNRIRLSWKHSKQNDGSNSEDYINASLIEVPCSNTKYIAAQAPLMTTLNDWFQMIYEYEVNIIVMLCNIVELGRIKCEKYWPSVLGEEHDFAGVSVQLVNEGKFDEYCKRIMKLHWPNGEERFVVQLHYTEWPDHGNPQSELNFIEMIRCLDRLQVEDPDKPILVHCSAGCGRTGTVIAANIIRERINKQLLTSDLNMMDVTRYLRTQRVSMIQTSDQYQFLHKVVVHFCKEKLDVMESISNILNSVILIEKSSSSSTTISSKTNSDGGHTCQSAKSNSSNILDSDMSTDSSSGFHSKVHGLLEG